MKLKVVPNTNNAEILVKDCNPSGFYVAHATKGGRPYILVSTSRDLYQWRQASDLMNNSAYEKSRELEESINYLIDMGIWEIYYFSTFQEMFEYILKSDYL